MHSPEIVVAGVDPTVHDAWIVALSEGQHGLAFVKQQQGQYLVMFRRTLADGTPGPAAQQVASVIAETFPDSTHDFSPVQVRLAARSEGGWVVAWTDGDYPYARAYDANDQPIGPAVVLATGFSLAQIVWLLRGSVLITKLMSSMPIWFTFDPLPILNSCHRLALADQMDHDASLPDDSLLDIATQ